MRNWSKGLAAALAISTVTALVIPWSLSGARLRHKLEQNVAIATGLNATAGGPIVLRLLPTPRITIHTVAIHDAQRIMTIDAQEVHGRLRLLPLIAGRLELASLTLVLPAIVIDAGALGSQPDAIREADKLRQRVASARDSKRAGALGELGSIGISGGRIVVRGLRHGAETTQIGDVNATLDWRGASAPASLDGSFIWRGEKADISAQIGALETLFANSQGVSVAKPATSASLKIDSRLLNLALNGTLSVQAGWQFNGKVDASSRALRPLISLTGWSVPIPGPLASAQLNATAKFNPAAFAFSNVKLVLDNNQFDGALSVRMGEKRAAISGTLATRNLTIDPRNPGLIELRDPDGGWSQRTLPIASLFHADIDIRMSANELRFGRIAMAESALTALIKDDVCEFSLAANKAYGGTLNATLRIVNGPILPTVRTKLQFNDIESGAFLHDASRNQRFSGAAKGEVEFGAAGVNVHELIKAASGALQVEIANGAIRGIDLGGALARAHSQPLSIPDEIRSGQTSFTKAQTVAKLNDGVVQLELAFIRSEQIEANISGAIQLLQRTLHLSVDASRKLPEKPAAAAHGEDHPTPHRLKVDLTGSWDSPLLLVDPETLIQRSEAAAPLLRTFRRMRSNEAATPQ